MGLPNLRPAIHSDPDLTRGHPMPNKQATVRLLESLVGKHVGALADEGARNEQLATANIAHHALTSDGLTAE